MFGNTLDVIRVALLVALISTCGWQTIYSINKFFQFDIMTTFSFEHPTLQVFPSVSLCGYKKVANLSYMPNDQVLDWTFKEDMDTAVEPDFLMAFAHDRVQMMSLDGEPFYDYEEDEKQDEEFIQKYVDAWSTNYYFLPAFHPNITFCLTYKPPEEFTGGADSYLHLFINTSKVDRLDIYLHSAQNGLIMNNPIYGSSKFKSGLNSITTPGHGFTYKIITTRKTVRPRQKLPCNNKKIKEDNYLLNCVEDWFERTNHCKLPWRVTEDVNEKSIVPVCNSTDQLREYKDLQYKFYDSGPINLYETTGCYYSCEYMTVSPLFAKFASARAIWGVAVLADSSYLADFENLFNFLFHQTFQHFSADLFEEEPIPEDVLSFHLFLAPDGIVVDQEVLAFDFYDLVGNVGGFLGLFLGASILSMYDSLKNSLEKMAHYKK